MLTLGEAGGRVYGSSLYYLYSSANLKLFQTQNFLKSNLAGFTKIFRRIYPLIPFHPAFHFQQTRETLTEVQKEFINKC